MNWKKGFVHTMEAIIGSSLLLGMVLVAVPELAETSTERAVQRNVKSSLESLDKSGDLRDNLSLKEVENEIEPFIPPGYSFKVRKTSAAAETRKDVSPPAEFYFSKDGSYGELQLWIDSASNLDVKFDGETLVDGRSSAGYVEKSLPSTDGWLNFTGSGDLDFQFDTYSRNGGTIDQENARTVNYMLGENGTRELQVVLWTE